MPKKSSSPKSAAVARNENMPLFFQNPVPIDVRRHAKAGLVPVQDTSFATETNSIVINVAEFYEASRQYPIVFTQGEVPFAAVIVGLEQQNYFVDDKGNWADGAYIPAYVRRYPFVFMDAPSRNEFMLCIDEGASQYRENGGDGAIALYDNGAPSAFTRKALEFCSAYQSNHKVTAKFCEDIKAAGLLAPTRLDTKLPNGRTIKLGGFLSIDEKKLASLPDETVLDFYKKGWMPLVYTVMLSAANWKSLSDKAIAIEKKHKAN